MKKLKNVLVVCDSADGTATRNTRREFEALYRLHSLKIKTYSIIYALDIDRNGSHIVEITAERTEFIGTAACVISIVLCCTITVHFYLLKAVSNF